MFSGNGNRKIMRGPVWSLFLFLSAFTFISVTISFFQGSAEGKVALAIPFSALYIAAYFVLPRVIKPKAQQAQAEENVPLDVPARLTIIRDHSIAAVVIPTVITLNGAVAATISANGETATIPLTMRKNILQTNTTGSKNVRIVFEAENGADGELHVKGGVFQVKTLRWK